MEGTGSFAGTIIFGNVGGSLFSEIFFVSLPKTPFFYFGKLREGRRRTTISTHTLAKSTRGIHYEHDEYESVGVVHMEHY